MTDIEKLSDRAIAISISKSPDMATLGLAEEHLQDAMAEVARHLLAAGARLKYGGDLRPGGFTKIMFELIIRHRSDADLGDGRIGVINYLPWPVHISLTAEALQTEAEELRGVAEQVYLTLDGDVMTLDERKQLAPQEATDKEWAEGLTAMRDVVTAVSDARIVLGGKVEDFKGRMPGVGEEALVALRAGQPLFLLGGFGGCARDIAEDMGLAPTWLAARRSWKGRAEFAGFTSEHLNNGLNDEENATLATTVIMEQAVTLILTGLLRKGINETSVEVGE